MKKRIGLRHRVRKFANHFFTPRDAARWAYSWLRAKRRNYKNIPLEEVVYILSPAMIRYFGLSRPDRVRDGLRDVLKLGGFR